MSEYKLLVADIDGTAVDHGSQGQEVGVEHPSKIAFDRAFAQGKNITFATGRNFPKAKAIIEAFDITDPVIVNGGSQIINPETGLPIWEKHLHVEIGKRVCDFITEQGTDPDLQIGFGYLSEVPFSQVTDEQIEELIYLDLIGFSNDQQTSGLLEFIEKFEDAVGVSVPSPQFPGRRNVIVTNAQATKYHALQELQNILGIKEGETISVGDGNNDLPLFEASGLKVAMDNGDKELKEAADLIVSSVSEHGIVEVIENYLIQQS